MDVVVLVSWSNCQKMFCIISKLILDNTSSKHAKKDLEGLISCDICGQRYSDQKYLDAHITKKHPEKSNLADFIKQQVSFRSKTLKLIL